MAVPRSWCLHLFRLLSLELPAGQASRALCTTSVGGDSNLAHCLVVSLCQFTPVKQTTGRRAVLALTIVLCLDKACVHSRPHTELHMCPAELIWTLLIWIREIWKTERVELASCCPEGKEQQTGESNYRECVKSQDKLFPKGLLTNTVWGNSLSNST